MAARVLTVAALAAFWGSASAGAVVELTADNFDTVTSEGDWIVEFYAPWCIHCQRLAPHLEKAAAQLAGTGASRIAKVDGTAWRSLSFRFNVNGYPTLFHVHNEGDNRGVLGALGGGAREVRRINIEHTVQGVKEAATGGWREFREPLPWGTGPFGPVALAKFYGLRFGEGIFKIHEPIANALGVPPIIAGFVMGLIMLVAFTGMLIGFAVWLGPTKRDEEDDHDD